MRTYVIAEGITVELTNRTADAYEEFVRARQNLAACDVSDLYDGGYHTAVFWVERAYARLIGEPWDF